MPSCPTPAASALQLNRRVAQLARALGLRSGLRSTDTRQGLHVEWPLGGPTGPVYSLALWVGYARCIPGVEGQLAEVSLKDEAQGLTVRQTILLSPDHERVNRVQAQKLARQRFGQWLENECARIAAGESITAAPRRRPQPSGATATTTAPALSL